MISNGLAVMSLGYIGALVGKPVMEGGGVLIKTFLGINVFNTKAEEHNPDQLLDLIAALEPSLAASIYKT